MVVIRKAEPADRAILVEIGVRAWTEHVFSFEPETPGLRARIRRAFEDLVEDHPDSVTLAEMDGAIRGWAAREHRDQIISDLWVDPDWQGRGIGSALLSALLADIRAAGYDRARLTAHARNGNALRFYEGRGFEIVSRSLEFSTSLGREIEKVTLERAI